MTGRGWFVVLLTLGLFFSPLEDGRAQEPVKTRTVDVPRIGRAAPPVVLPWATRQGPGPDDQPFRLSAELGRVVVLLFHAGDGFLGELADRADSLFGSGVVLAVVTADSLAGSVERAGRLALPFKFLTDRDGEVGRRYGFGSRDVVTGGVAWVVSPLGRLSGKVTGLRAGAPGGFQELAMAVAKARRD